jgi:mesencephalic astrocyte-derived neurotrophic factor
MRRLKPSEEKPQNMLLSRHNVFHCGMLPWDFSKACIIYAYSHVVSFFAPPAVFSSLSLSLSTLVQQITVCVKVMDDVRASMDKDDSRKKDKVEAALGKYCGIIPGHDNNPGANLSARERKICYYIDPIKRDVAQPFSLGMSSLKVCQRINKSNPEICSVKFPVKTEKMEAKDITKLRVKQLKEILAQRGVECKGCVEKEEFVKKVQETEHLASDEF